LIFLAVFLLFSVANYWRDIVGTDTITVYDYLNINGGNPMFSTSIFALKNGELKRVSIYTNDKSQWAKKSKSVLNDDYDCDVYDLENWRCEGKDNKESYVQMIDGVYSQHTWIDDLLDELRSRGKKVNMIYFDNKEEFFKAFESVRGSKVANRHRKQQKQARKELIR